MFRGSMVALITPFDNEGRFDEDTYRELIEFQIENGTDVLVPCGTTGESATLSYGEHDRVIRACVEQVNGRRPVLAGTGSNATHEAIDISQRARELGADGVLLVTPYYNKPSQEGLYLHYRQIADRVHLPQVLYNVPGRTGINMTAETVLRLAEIPNIVAIKEASGNLTQISESIAGAGDTLDVISGDVFLTFPMMACGAKGVISVTANIMPREVKALVAAVNEGRWEEARKLHLELLPIHRAMFLESNPVPVKTAAAMMGKCGEVLRLPLSPLSAGNREKLSQILRRYRLS
ncbi:MAG: 4-hydroxy-tetrahydrodipicolinate synthase [Deltaproteobacteria bacterium]|nr:4-hydroxy-tetrahydrodipicolinate synthase [Deltaproteobacteria bacterium]